MPAIAVFDMASVPPWSHSNSSEEIADKLHTAAAWRRENGDRSRINAEPVVMNGIRSNSDDLSYGSSSLGGKRGNSENDSDHIVSVHNNPFFKTYGIRTQRRDSRGEETGLREGSVTLRSTNNKDDVFDDEPQEYRPGSGFVSKLTGKFASLTTREENHYRPKRTASLENLLDDHSKKDSSIREDVPRRSKGSISTSLSKSVENVTSLGKSLRPLKVPTSSHRSSYDSNERKSLKSPREAGDVLPLGRDDIIIIEKEPMEKPESKQIPSPSTGKFSGPQVISLKEETKNADELPKPNTVLSVRSMFEKSSSAPPLPIYSTATGPPVLSPTTNIKAPSFATQKAVSKVSPSVTSEFAQNNVSNNSEEKPRKRMAPKPPVQNRQLPEQKTTLPQPKPRTKQSPVIAVAPYISDTNSNEQELKISSKSNNVKKSSDDSGGIWPEESVSKVFDSSAIIKPPESTKRHQSKPYSESSPVESTSSVSKLVSKAESEPKKEKEQKNNESKPITNGTSTNNGTSYFDNSRSDSSYGSYKKKLETPKPETNSQSSLSSTSSESSNSKSDSIFRPEPTRNMENHFRYDSKLEQIFPSEEPANNSDIHLDLVTDGSPVEVLPEGEGPVRARVISERLKKDGNKTGHHQSSVVNNTSQDDSSPAFALKKRKVNSNEENTEPRNTTNNEMLNFRKNLKSVSDSKSSKVSQVFDTSQIVRTPAQSVPRLDLTGITDDQRNGFYQDGYKPTEIKPCTIIFIGAEVKLGRSLLEKNRSKKGKITFSDSHNQTFEYPSEEQHLEDYLAQHPNEPAEILIFEDVVSITTESSDDVDEEPETPRGGRSSSEDTLKSNTSLNHSGGLSNYRSKYQMEYTFGAAMEEKEEAKPAPPPPEEDENSQIIPGDEDITWSTETNSDLLF